MSADQQQTGSESDQVFLLCHGVPAMVKEALGRLGTQQPAEPLAFLADYFSAIEGRPVDVEQARACLAQAHWQSPGYLFAVKEAFDCLRQLQRDDCRVYAVCGLHCMQLLELLLRDAPLGGSGVLLQRLRLRQQVAVQFGRFYSAVMSTLAFKAYMADCVALYADAEAMTALLKSSGNNREACDCMLSLLDSTLDAAAGGQHVVQLFSCLDGLTPPALQNTLSAARPSAAAATSSLSGRASAQRQPTGPMSLADFLSEAAAVFVRRLLV